VQIPERVRGYLFEYELMRLNTDGLTADIKYTNRIYKNDSESFERYKEDDDEEEEDMSYPLSDIQPHHLIWKRAQVHCNAVFRNQKINITAIRTAKQNSLKNTWDFKDIDDFFKTHGKGPKLLEFEFEPVTTSPTTYDKKNGGQGEKWIWRHRTVPSSNGVSRFASTSGKSFDTGSLTKFLSRISPKEFPEACARGKHIMQLNGSVTINVDDNTASTALDRRTLLKQQVRSFGMA
jgi:hypothetical protein